MKKTKKNKQLRFPSFLKPQRIVIQVALISSTLIIISLGLFILATIPYQRTAILDAMKSEARSTVTSIDQVTASAIITEDFGTVVEHCLRVVQESPSIVYVVVTRNDGFSLIITKQGWEQKTLKGAWHLRERGLQATGFSPRKYRRKKCTIIHTRSSIPASIGAGSTLVFP